jgi:hypothetical protein
MCSVLLPPGGYPIAVYRIIFFHPVTDVRLNHSFSIHSSTHPPIQRSNRISDLLFFKLPTHSYANPIILLPIKSSTRHSINQSNHCNQTVTFRYTSQQYCHITHSLMAAKDVANQSSTLASHIVRPATKAGFRIW